MRYFLKPAILLLLAAFISEPSFSQRSRRYKRYEVGGIMGSSHYLGEIGGKAGNRRDFISDIQLQKTRPLLGAFLNYKFSPTITLGGTLAYGNIAGDDKLSTNLGRRLRNVNFRTHIIELSFLCYGNIITYKDITRRYMFFRNRKNYNMGLFAFAGVGVFHFNPKTEYQGEYYALQPLGTEGQGVIPGIKKYSLIQMCIPFGMGLQFTSRYPLRLGLDVGYRKIFTDYLDDVSTTYVDPAVIEAANGPVAGALANRIAEVSTKQLDLDTGYPGVKRGDPTHKDAYFFIQFKVGYAFNPKKKFRYRAKF